MDWLVLKFFIGVERGYANSSYWVCSCDHCRKDSLWLSDNSGIGGRIILPSLVAAPFPHEDLPEDCKRDFEEAREICTQSPRGAAALLRLTLQKLCAHVGGHGKNINDDIKLLIKEGLTPQVQQALDIVRVTGNHAVHPGELSLEDNPENVTVMFQMINLIVDELISRPKMIAERFNSLPIRDLEAVAKRDKPKPQT